MLKHPPHEPLADTKIRPLFAVAQEFIYLIAISLLAAAVAARSAMTAAGVEEVATRASSSAWSFLAVFAAMTFLVVLFLRSARVTKLFGAMFAVAILSGIGHAALTLAGPGIAVIAVSLCAVIYYRNPSVLAYDAVLAFGMAGVAAAVGIGFREEALLVIMSLLAVYDVIAVYGTKHMVRLGRTMLRRKVFFAMILPERPSGLKTRTADVSRGGGFAFLGTGDLILPALLVASSAVTRGFSGTWPIVAGAAVGLLVMNAIFLSQKIRKPMPALPPIAVGAIVGYLISTLIS